MSIPIRQMIAGCLAPLVAVLIWSPWALGVQNANPPQKTTTPTTTQRTADEDAPNDKTFGELMASWKNLISQLVVLREKYAVAAKPQRAEIVDQYTVLRREGLKMAPLLQQAAAREYRKAPNKDADLAEFLLLSARDNILQQQFEVGDRLATMLNEGGVDQLKFKGIDGREIFWMVSWAKYGIGDWQTADLYLKKSQAARLIGPRKGKHRVKAYHLVGDEAKRMNFEAGWKKEQDIRAAEAKDDDLPRVLLKTTQGDIVLELFENEAPNTVANFVYLVEKKFYDGLAFNRVLLDFMAQGGDPKGDGSGGPGYRIKCECGEKNHRKHFRGSVSMAHGGPNTGGSQFFLCFVPTPHLDGQHTVFGRVVEGIENMSKLREGDKNRAADKIITARVIRKRKQEYKPTTL